MLFWCEENRRKLLIGKSGLYVLCGFDGGRGGHDHEYAVNQNSGDDEHRKELMNQNIDRHTPYWIEGIEDP